MCIGFEATFTRIDFSFSIINMYQINQLVVTYVNANYATGTNGTPDVEMGDLTTTEQGFINCTISLRQGKSQKAYDDMADALRDLIIKEGTSGANVLGTHNKDVMNSKETIELDRAKNMKYAKDMYPNDTPAQEKKLFEKVYMETYGHELCHSLGENHPGSEVGYGTPGFYTTSFGRCERDIFFELFNELPPSYDKTFNQPVDLEWEVSCMINISGSSGVFLDSLHSGAAASQAYPAFDIEYHNVPNPYL